MKGMSEREYAAHSGLSRGGVQKARKNGRLVVYDDGSINAAASDVRRAEMTDPDQQRRSLGGDGLASGAGETSSYIKARTLLTKMKRATPAARAAWSSRPVPSAVTRQCSGPVSGLGVDAGGLWLARW